MKNNLLLLLGLLAFTFSACNNAELEKLRQEKQALEGKLKDFEGEKDLVKGEYSEAIETLNAIEDTLRQIAIREKQISELANSKDMSGNLSQRQAILERLENLKKANQQANDEARRLQAGIKAERIKNEQLRNMIKQAEQRLIDKEKELEQAQTMIDGLRTALNKMEAQLLEKSGELATAYQSLKAERDQLAETKSELEARVQELTQKNTFIQQQAQAYVVCGTRPALRKKDILMDLGKKLTREYQKNVKKHGTSVDYYNKDEIGCADGPDIVEILPERAASSYEIQGSKVIIKNAQQFWLTDKVAILVQK
jgi:chromosome segregation ATPase